MSVNKGALEGAGGIAVAKNTTQPAAHHIMPKESVAILQTLQTTGRLVQALVRKELSDPSKEDDV